MFPPLAEVFSMAYASNPYDSPQFSVAAMAAADERTGFICKTYLHLVGAIVALVGLEAILLQSPFAPALIGLMVGSQYSWLIVLGLFMGVNWLANSWALSATSLPKQYAGLGLYVVAQAVILLPPLFFATTLPQYSGVVTSAAVSTLSLFVGLTAVVFITRKDFSFLRSALMFGGFAAMGFIVCAVVFSFQLGPIFTYVMIAFACCYILYDTSNVLHNYRIGQHVAASLALFSSIVLLFWYVLRLLMSFRD